jgi:hypothetical protein
MPTLANHPSVSSLLLSILAKVSPFVTAIMAPQLNAAQRKAACKIGSGPPLQKM